MTGKPRPDANDAATAPYWEAARRYKLMLPRCDGCGLVFFPPRELCPGCWSGELSWQQMSGGGTVWTFTEVHMAFYDDTWAGDVPYVVAVVELDEGPHLLSNILEPDIASLAIGDRVEVVFGDRPEGVTLPMFRVVKS